MTITVLNFATGHVTVAGIYQEELPLPFLYALCLQQAPQPWFYAGWLTNFVPQGPGPTVVLLELVPCAFSLTVIPEHDNTNSLPRQPPVSQAYFPLPHWSIGTSYLSQHSHSPC